jgi:alkanesulfonate monooxygenase SsuD/methylene tetrahydromethanopterin reductase-like flavin-dependent oxidoreductase (luciferase family)
MPVEFIGMISTQDQSETRPSSGPAIDKDYVRRFARAHEDAGFDRSLSAARPYIAILSTGLIDISSWALSCTGSCRPTATRGLT